ncbi:MAG: DUF1573 domain-containing protein [Fimbriimonas sp.]
MITALIAFAQTIGPSLPAGVSPEFSAQVLAIEQMLEAGEFDKASERLKAMPTQELALAWDDSAVPADQRPALQQARDMAFATWNMFAPALKLSVSPSALVALKFVPSTEQKTADGAATVGMALKLERPKAQALIGLVRGADGKTVTSANNVHNDVVRAIGTYLGVGQSPVTSTAMFPMHYAGAKAILMKQDATAALENLRVLDTLRAAAAQKLRMTAAQPKLVVGDRISLGQMFQGERKSFKVDLRNDGNAPLQMWVKPDCGCTTVQGPQTIAPGQTLPMNVNFDSSEFDGDVDKGLTLVTNDPAEPVRHFKMEASVRPMYRFLTPSGPVAILDDKGGTFDFFLTFKDAEPFKIVHYDLTSLPATVSYVPWEGELADPLRGEPNAPRRGYKFTVVIRPGIPPGRSPGTLILQTDSKIAPRVQFIVQAQKGIVALPDELFLGEISEAKTSKLLVSRPGRPFKVLGVESMSPSFKATFKAVKDDEYALEVAYDGKAPKGELATMLKVKTDDPKQPLVNIPVIGTIR